MRNLYLVVVIVLVIILLGTCLAQAQANTSSLNSYRRVVVLPFESSVKGAGGLPDMVRAAVVGEMKAAGLFAEVISADATKDNEGTLELRARLVEFAPGNAAKRMFVGFGSGRANARFEFILSDAATNRVVWKSSIKHTASFWFNGYTSSAGERAELPEGIARKMTQQLQDVTKKEQEKQNKQK